MPQPGHAQDEEGMLLNRFLGRCEDSVHFFIPFTTRNSQNTVELHVAMIITPFQQVQNLLMLFIVLYFFSSVRNNVSTDLQYQMPVFAVI